MNTALKLFNLLSSQEKKKTILLILMMLVMALLETAGLVSILPFLTILANQELIETNKFLNSIFQFSKFFGVENRDEFLFILGVIVFFIFIISLIFKSLTVYAMTRFTKMREYTIGRRLIESYLRQPYSWFLDKHSADLGKNILSEVFNVIERGLGPLLTLLAQSIVVISILIVLLIIDVFLALSLFVTLGTIYLIIYLFMSNKLKVLGKISVDVNEDRFKTVVEAFGASKEIKLSGLEASYVSRFSSPSVIYAKNQAVIAIIAQMPKFILEGLGFGGIILIILYLMSVNGSLISAIPAITLYAFAGYRLLPAIQQIYATLTSLRFSSPAIDLLYEDLKNLESFNLDKKITSPISFHNSILLKDVKYSYPGTSEFALKDINIKISAVSRVGIVGPTGCGKTTLVDLILGLLEPREGILNVDTNKIDKFNRHKWQSLIGYVPQHIYLSDDTIANNIAFGLEEKDIDKKLIEIAAKSANLHEFITSELPLGYQTEVGERGVRLSGGQIQRIGIARALYNKPRILIMDEATSALDNLTEKAVIDAIDIETT